MIVITRDILIGIAPAAKRTKLLDALIIEMNAQFKNAGIDTKEELRHFLSQAAHETQSFLYLVERGSGKQYENRKDLGNTVKGFGPLYKGRGIFQTTGFNNYLRLSDICPENLSFTNSPQLLETPKWAVWSAIVYWNERHLSDIAVQPDSTLIYSKYLNKKLTPIEYITFRINGGLNGVEDRKLLYERAKKAIP